jgi:hypothetical protein
VPSAISSHTRARPRADQSSFILGPACSITGRVEEVS